MVVAEGEENDTNLNYGKIMFTTSNLLVKGAEKEKPAIGVAVDGVDRKSF